MYFACQNFAFCVSSYTWEGASRRFLHECNVFQTEINGEEFSVFLIAKEEKLRFSICGIDGEPQRITSLIKKEKMSAGGPVTLTLSFEGKPAGSVKVIECMSGRRFT